MRKRILIALTLLCLVSAGASAQMTDTQVAAYVKGGLSSGKTEKQIATELMAKGVTVQQMERLRDQYQGGTDGANATVGAMNQSARANQRINRANTGLLGESELAMYNITSTLDSLELEASKPREIYGHSMFSSKTLSFEPNENLATPENYVLGPGDEVVIEIWGANEASIRETISPEGRISVSQIGPIYLNGLTIKQANAQVRRVFAQNYAGVMGDAPVSDVSLSLGAVRTIQVHVFGEVEVPGTYRLSGFSTVFHALYHAGGVTELGSVRNINVVRAGKVVANVDIYPFLVEGKMESNIRLQDGDVITVPVYENLVNVDGLVKRPMDYEMRSGETVKGILDYAGGFDGGAYTKQVRINRAGETQRSILTVTEDRYASVVLEAGDSLYVDGMTDKFSNRVEIKGKVYRPGAYELGSEISTVRQLLEHAGGVLEDAFLNRARIERKKDDLTSESLSFNLGSLLSGKTTDIKLRKNDVVIVDDLHLICEVGTLTINGFVNEPQEVDYAENMTIEDLILLAGGLQRGASSARVEVSRRLMNDGSLMPNDTLSRVYTFPLDITLSHNDANDFRLEPYDIVSVRKSPDYRPQSNVTIEGEIAFPGEYSMVTVGERISSIIQRAGGITSHAYIKGATLRRKMSEEEKSLQKAVDKMTKLGATKDMLDESLLDVESELADEEEKETGEEYYSVALELDKAMMNPGSDFDLSLKEGDRLMIPEFLSTVKIAGTVMYPNSVTYKSGASVGYYINKAGGYGDRAKRSRVYIVYMNGNVSKARFGTKVEPGCEIIVPSKSEKNRTTTSEILATTSAATSITTAIATLARLFM